MSESSKSSATLSTAAGPVPTVVLATSGRLRAAFRRFRRLAMWGSLGMFGFTLFAWLSLPTRALAWRIGHEARQRGYLVDVEDVSVSIFGGVTLHNVEWTFSPSRPDEIPGKFVVDEIDVDVSILSLLIGNLDIDVEAIREEGRIVAHYERDSEESAFALEIEDLPLYDVPKARQAMNVPLMGLFAMKVDLTMPGNKFAKANGMIEVTCAACKIGDGESKLYIPGSKSLKNGMTIPEIDLGTFTGKMTVEGGKAKTEGAMETKSDDFELSVTGSIKLKDPVQKSRFDMTIKMNLTESLQARSEALRLMIQTADPKSKLDAPEKGLGYVLSGPLDKPSFRAIKAKSAAQSRQEKRDKKRKRDEAKLKKDLDKKKKKNAADAKKGEESKDDGGAEAKPSVGEPLNVEPIEPAPAEPAAAEPTPVEPPPEAAEPAPAEPAPEGEQPALPPAEGEQPAAPPEGEQPAADPI